MNDILGQDHLVGQDGVLRRAIEKGSLPSLILWGPPGVGKTTLARVIANELDRPFYTLSAISSGVKDVRTVIDKAQDQGLFGGQGPILFIDEIHRFSKSQQDSLLGAVEKGTITLIGATTENPSFEVIAPLLSRCQTYTLEPLGRERLNGLLEKVIQEDEHLAKRTVELQEREALLRLSGGDARKLLNILELVINAFDSDPVVVTDDLVASLVQQNPVLYDKTGEQHYDIVSAFIKSIRGSDPNGAVYWLARMVEGGEDPKFIARRLVILASEDIGNANPTALVIANNAFQAVENIGWPEARIILSQCATYLATSPKSNAAYTAINRAQDKVRETGDLSVPLHIRNAPTELTKDLGYGKGYRYAHDHAGNFAEQEFLPEELNGTPFYEPGDNKKEQEIRRFLRERWKGKYGY